MNPPTISEGARLLQNDPRFASGAVANALGLGLTPAERSLLLDCEDCIKRGVETFLDVGRALQAIRDGKLYREKFGTFQDYCRERWNFGGRHARRFLSAGEIWNELKSASDEKRTHGSGSGSGATAAAALVLPTNERQVRPLLSVPKGKRLEVWEKAQAAAAAEGKPVSGKLVSKAKAEVCPKSKVQGPKSAAEVVHALHSPVRERFRIDHRPGPGRQLWRIKEGPGWKIAALVETLREAGDWVKERGCDPADVQVTDAETWKSLEYWNNLGTEPGQKESTKGGDKVSDKVPKEHLVLQQIAACMDAVGVLRNMVVSTDPKARVLIMRIFDALESLDAKWRRAK